MPEGERLFFVYFLVDSIGCSRSMGIIMILITTFIITILLSFLLLLLSERYTLWGSSIVWSLEFRGLGSGPH